MKVLQIRLKEREDRIVESMRANGYPLGETIREILRNWAKENLPELPAYVAIAKEKLDLKKKATEEQDRIKNMTPEEYATKVLLGKITPDGKQVEFRDQYGDSIFYKLKTIKDVNIDDDFTVFRHINFVNRVHKFANGQEPTEKEYNEVIFKNW